MNCERKSSLTTMGNCQDKSPVSSSDNQILENLPQETEKIQRECAETGIDWISQLPDSLIIQILSLMPTGDACRTTVLSKRWQFLWTFIDNLIFDIRSIPLLCSSEDNWFISFTNNVLCLLSCSKIKKFRRQSGFILGVSYGSKIDKWLEIALKKKVEDLDLEIFYTAEGPYSLPQILCSSSSILKLKCNYCRIAEDCILNWTSLRSLTLTYLYLLDKHSEQIVSNCSQLEALKLCHSSGFHRLHITSPKCRKLQLIDHVHPNGDWGSFV